MTGRATPAAGSRRSGREAFLELPYFDHMHRYLPALFTRDGWQVAHVDVSHKARGGGRSHYSNLQRAAVGVADLAGVAWLMKRRKKARPGRDRAGARGSDPMDWLMRLLHVNSATELMWVIFGLLAQVMFTMRFLLAMGWPRNAPRIR